MSWMFYKSEFNGDIFRWDVSNVEDMDGMFKNSKFNRNISEWDVLKVKYMSNMFDGCSTTKPWWYIKDNKEQ